MEIVCAKIPQLNKKRTIMENKEQLCDDLSITSDEKFSLAIYFKELTLKLGVTNELS